ncbi:MAG: protein translocase subunit SecD [Desulfovibrionaceae bacterium]|nr:protein translocase subunit SecD [Desulfovibrionaceae bacterium]
MKALRWRLVLSLAALVAALVYALPNMPAVADSPLGGLLPQSRINLGLDLKGGMNLTLGVDVEKALQNTLTVSGQDMRDRASRDGVNLLRPRLNAEGLLDVVLPKTDQAAAFLKMLSEWYPDLSVAGESDSAAGRTFTLTLSDAARRQAEEMTLEQVVRTIRNRIDQFGVAEPDIRKQADNQVQVQLPGLTDPERAIQIVGQTAHLEFHLVRDDIDPRSLMLPPGTSRFPSVEKNGHEGSLVLDTEALMSGEGITNARPAFDQFGKAYVALKFDPRAATQFERITGDNVKRRMAIVLDGKVYSAPTIQDRIAGGEASITGQFTTAEAQDLAIVLRAGSLPAPVTVLEERTVGPSLGQESINSGILAALVGALAVIVIMPAYYGLSGIIADLMLCFTLTLLMAGMSGFGATLTLPGIAGIVLTIGMAVDANVLIYERIREELKLGLSPGEAVAAGFSRASMSITDSNLTTIIAAAILYQFGTGPIRGFAVTLSLGIIASMFTAIFVSHAIFDLWMSRNGGKHISV